MKPDFRAQPAAKSRTRRLAYWVAVSVVALLLLAASEIWPGVSAIVEVLLWAELPIAMLVFALLVGYSSRF